MFNLWKLGEPATMTPNETGMKHINYLFQTEETPHRITLNGEGITLSEFNDKWSELTLDDHIIIVEKIK